ncbi:MAG TPA: DUF418 domain-containing protein [Ferruginibacter sp.]|nr:DUF418 domain-containing protein [Ferruginibacter sp.]
MLIIGLGLGLWLSWLQVQEAVKFQYNRFEYTKHTHIAFYQLHRIEIYYLVGAIWLFQIIFSHIWLHFFRFGLFEWAWRSLTYWKRMPFIK